MGLLRFVALGMLLVAAAGCGDDDSASISTGSDDEPADVAAEPRCEEIEAFADALVDTGITYDYQPSKSPTDLAALTDAVFGGRLTGRTTTTELPAEEGDLSPRPFVGYEVEITRVVKGPALQVGENVNVFVERGGMQHRSDGHDTDAVAPGAPVAVLAFEHEPLDELTASIEGFMTSCPSGPLLGWTGSQGEWASLQTTQQVLDAVDRSDTTTTTVPSTTSPSASSTSTTSPTDQRGETAVWRVDEEDPPTTSATSFSALVTRLGCNAGETGKVLEPRISINDDEIVVTFWVEELPDGTHTCPGNNEVPYLVEIGEPIGQRSILDGACLGDELATTSFCSEGASRWSP